MAVAPEVEARDVRRTPVVDAVERVAPAVVHIAAERSALPADFSASGAELGQGVGEFEVGVGSGLLSLGSGLLYDRRGYVLTNAHVVSKTVELQVLLADGRRFVAATVGVDQGSDLAVLFLESGGRLPVAPLGTSSDLRIGETLIAIGNPFGLSHTVTTGVLSATGRRVKAGRRVFSDFLQTDASINPGNSGGPVLNLAGDVVGIATALYRDGQGIGFAIPIDRARRVAVSIMQHGRVQAVWIGLATRPADRQLAQSLELPGGQGLVVTGVVREGPAAVAGLRQGDVVYAVDGHSVGSHTELESRLWHGDAGSRVKIGFVRDGDRKAAPVKPLAADSPKLLMIAQSVLGLSLVATDDGAGLRVSDVRPGSRAAERGLAEGDLVHEMDGVRLSDLDAFRRGFFKALATRSVLLLVEQRESSYYVPLTID